MKGRSACLLLYLQPCIARLAADADGRQTAAIAIRRRKKRQILNFCCFTLLNVSSLYDRFEDKEVQRDLKLLPYKIVTKDGNPYIQVQKDDENKVCSPEEINAMILAKMKETAETYLGYKVKGAVITFPDMLIAGDFDPFKCRSARFDESLLSQRGHVPLRYARLLTPMRQTCVSRTPTSSHTVAPSLLTNNKEYGPPTAVYKTHMGGSSFPTVEESIEEHEIADDYLTDGYLTEKEQQQLLLDEEALRETLEEQARAEKEQEERIKQEQAHD
ncbi:luminal binding protein 5 [Tanacetum coccineum]